MFKVRIWDLPTRVFHWSLVLCFGGLMVSGEIGSAALVWHLLLGYGFLGLLLFRLLWGVFGGYWSRFGTFVTSPHAVLRYLRGDSSTRRAAGHTPLGALSVLALLGFSLLEAVSGLASGDSATGFAPLVGLVGTNWSSMLTFYHAKAGKLILIVLVQLHISAIIYYWLRRGENLLLPMLSGNKQLAQAAPPAQDNWATRCLAFGLWVACLLFVASLVRWAA